MQSKTKLLLAGGILLAGFAAAFFFRKPKSDAGLDPVAAAPAVASKPAARGAKTGAANVTPHLLGRIDAVDSASLDMTPPPAPTADQTAPDARERMPAAPPWADGHDEEAIEGGSNSIDLNPPTRERLTASTKARRLRRHRVQDGDTLSELALKYLGSAERYHEIVDANRQVLSSPDLLPVGVELTIPDRGEIASAAPVAPGGMVEIPNEQLRQARAQTKPSTPATTVAGRSYRVQAGDTLRAIARHFYGDANRYGDLLTANHTVLSRPEDLREGMTLVVP